MNWEAIGAIAELVGAIAVVATLGYLAVQIRHQSKQLQGNATIAVQDYQRLNAEELNGDQELFDIVRRGNDDMNALSQDEQARFALFCIKETGWWEMCFHLYRQGALHEDVFRSKDEYLTQLYASTGRNAWWQNHRVVVSKEFASHVDSALSNTEAQLASESNPIFAKTT